MASPYLSLSLPPLISNARLEMGQVDLPGRIPSSGCKEFCCLHAIRTCIYLLHVPLLPLAPIHFGEVLSLQSAVGENLADITVA